MRAHPPYPLPLELTVRAVPGAAATAPKTEVRWVDTPAANRMVSKELRASDEAGLDVETALAFGTLCLLQIARRKHTFLIDPLGDLKPIIDVLSGAEPMKVIHHARLERRILAAIGVALDGVYDTLEAARRAGGKDALGGHSLAIERERERGIVLDKTPQTSNWSCRPLDVYQLKYAALDAKAVLAVHERFNELSLATFDTGGV